MPESQPTRLDPSWALGPFLRPNDALPVIAPDPDSRFDCPMRKESVRWEFLHTFNPAAVVRDGKINVLYRAEDDRGTMNIGGHTSRIGLAESTDGMTFGRRDTPIFYPGADSQKDFEWPGGCEDPRIAEAPNGIYVLTYTQYNGRGSWRIGLATSPDLIRWTKHGSPFAGTRHDQWKIKSAGIVQEIRNGRLIAARINGKYWMYFGEHEVYAATSEDLVAWIPLEDDRGNPRVIMRTRPGYFDSGLTEVGPPPVRTSHGIILIYNGKNKDPRKDGDPSLPQGVYACGQALFSNDDPARLVTRLDRPFFKPELKWEKTGQYEQGTTFAEGLVFFKDSWLLFYGCADTYVGMARTK